MLCNCFTTFAFAGVTNLHYTFFESPESNDYEGYIDLTVHEVWDLVNDTSNGIQYLIDVRYDPEWTAEHIDAPYPEHARHHCKCEWVNETILQNFMDFYEGKEIILYCKSGGRSVGAANTLIDNGFVGTIYNMVGGIDLWRNIGYPTVSNRAPDSPQISGPITGVPDVQYNFTISTFDADYDAVSYYVKWGDGQSEIYSSSFASEEEIIFSHSWSSSGIYLIEVKARDEYFAESEWNTYEIKISITELSIDMSQKGFGGISYEINNVGRYTAKNVTSTIAIKGGLLSGINVNHSCSGCDQCNSSINPGEQKTETSLEGGFIFGIGSIDILLSVSADNAETINLSKTGLVIGPIIIIE